MKNRGRDENAAAGKKSLKRIRQRGGNTETAGRKMKRNKDMEKRLSVWQSLHNFIKCTNGAERKGKEQSSCGWAGGAHPGISSSGDSCPPSHCSSVGQFLLVTQWQPQGFNIHVPLWPRTPESILEQTITHPLTDRNGQSWTETLIFPDGNFSVVDSKTLLYFSFFFCLILFMSWSDFGQSQTDFSLCSEQMVVPRIPASWQCQTALTFPSSAADFLLERKKLRTAHIVPFFFWIIKHSGQCRHKLCSRKSWDSTSEKQEWLLESLVVHRQLQGHIRPPWAAEEWGDVMGAPHIISSSSCPKELLWWAVQSPEKPQNIPTLKFRLYSARVQLQFPSYK